jgi:hypothetical protein
MAIAIQDLNRQLGACQFVIHVTKKVMMGEEVQYPKEMIKAGFIACAGE